jgi:hypothetical protein
MWSQKQHIFILHAGQGCGQPPLQALANQRSYLKLQRWLASLPWAAPLSTASTACTRHLLLQLHSASITSLCHESTSPVAMQTGPSQCLNCQPDADPWAFSDPHTTGSLQFYITGCIVNLPFTVPTTAGRTLNHEHPAAHTLRAHFNSTSPVVS